MIRYLLYCKIYDGENGTYNSISHTVGISSCQFIFYLTTYICPLHNGSGTYVTIAIVMQTRAKVV